MGMEDDTKDFLVTIVQTASLIILWMLVNVIIGIRMKLGLFEGQPTLRNYIYYALFLVSFFFLVKHLARKWKKVKHF
ncbi:MAG: hypothetical protein WKF88_03770 [Ferruginibacter sp.]